MPTNNHAYESASSDEEELDEPFPARHRREALTQLGECLKTELIAIDGYDRAVILTTHPLVSQRLVELRDDHARRTDLLRSRLNGSGDTPEESVGKRPSEIVDARHAPQDDGAAVSVLEALEHRALGLYAKGMALSDSSTREFFQTVLFPAQRRTLDLSRSLKGHIYMQSGWVNHGSETNVDAAREPDPAELRRRPSFVRLKSSAGAPSRMPALAMDAAANPTATEPGAT